MNRSHKICLISKTYTQDSIGQMIPTEETAIVFATVRSVSQTEANTPLDGLRPSLVFDVRLTSYSGQDTVSYQSTRYHIYRTFQREDGRVELYGAVREGT